MWELLLQNQPILGSDLTIRILTEFTRMLNATTEGQQMEPAWTTGNKWDIREEDYFLMVTKKAAWYTCISPTRLGILLASHESDKQGIKTDQNLMRDVIEFGTHVGISFQIIDDVLNLIGEESKYGKEIFGDLFEGKRTLMLIHLLHQTDQAEGQKIVEILSKPRQKKNLDEVRFVFERMRDLGSIDYAKQVAKRLSDDALSEFDKIASKQGVGHDASFKRTRSLFEYLTSRDY